MSAAAAWDLVPAPSRIPAGGRARLRLVPTGADVATAPVRVSRRGRLVLTLLVTAVLLAVAVTVLSGDGAAGLTIDHSTTVAPGQTLSEVAAAQLPGVRVGQAVAAIQLANDLNTTQVHAGQTLLIPAYPDR